MTLVLFGAGNIGRSFIAPIFSNAGYQVIFVEINRTVVDEINRRGAYEVVTVPPAGEEIRTGISSIRAIHAGDAEAVAAAVAAADIAATAVGAVGFSPVCDLIARGLAMRATTRPGDPLDVILAENIPGAAELARKLIAAVSERLAAGSSETTQVPLGLVETSIGKMVPVVPADVAARDPLVVYAEPYNTLIVDGMGFSGQIPQIPDLMAAANIRAYVDRKLYIHNLGHAAVAYLGFKADPGLKTIAGALSAAGVRVAAERAMLQSAAGLYAEYPDVFSPGDLESHVDDLLSRFANPALNDTVFRVGRDLRRKLGPRDRVVGALRLLARHSLPLDAVVSVYDAALGFRATDDAGLPHGDDIDLLVRALSEGREWILRSISGLDPEREPDRPVWEALVAAS